MWNRIRDRSRSVTPTQGARYLAIAPFWLTGIIVGSILAVAWTVLRWCWAAVVVGAEQATAGRLPHPEPQIVAQWAITIAVTIGVVFLMVT